MTRFSVQALGGYGLTLSVARVVHGHLCQGGVAPLVLMGSEVDVMKLRSSLEIFLGVAPSADKTFRTQVKETLAVLDASAERARSLS